MTELAAGRESGGARVPTTLPVLDGLRGLALLLVLSSHSLGEGGLHGKLQVAFHLLVVSGWTGVDLFFVLSGFLITRILLRAKGSSRYFPSFYGRRILRIFPLYYAFLFVTLVVFPAISANWREVVARGEPVSVWFYMENLWGTAHGNMGLAHLWSLAVEEQFYLVWPFLVWALSPRALVRVCIGAIAVAFAVRWHMNLHAGIAERLTTYGFTPARMNTLAAGALLAILAETRGFSPRLQRMARWGGALAVLLLLPVARHDVSLFSYGEWTQKVGFDLIALGWASLLVCAVTASPSSPLKRVFTWGPLRFVGKYSYGMYIYHVPILTWVLLPLGIRPWLETKVGFFPSEAIFFALVTTLVLGTAVASYELFESPFLKLKRFFEYESAEAPPPRVTPLAKSETPSSSSAAG